MSRTPSARHVCFTYNNPSSSPTQFQALLQAAERIRYAIFQLEEGENGTPHYQGYVESTWYKWENRVVQYKALSRRIHHVIGFSRGVPHLLDHEKFFGEIKSTAHGDYSSSGCEWEEVVSMFPVPSFRD